MFLTLSDFPLALLCRWQMFYFQSLSLPRLENWHQICVFTCVCQTWYWGTPHWTVSAHGQRIGIFKKFLKALFLFVCQGLRKIKAFSILRINHKYLTGDYCLPTKYAAKVHNILLSMTWQIFSWNWDPQGYIRSILSNTCFLIPSQSFSSLYSKTISTHKEKS